MTKENKGPPPRTVGIDSMILIYAQRVPTGTGKRSQKDIDLSVRAKLLLRELTESKARIVLPAIAIAELLVPVPTAKKGQVIAELRTMFDCHPFDVQATAIAAELWAKYKKLPQNLQYDKRDVLKSDAMIVATAKAAGATAFYSHDEKCRQMAQLVMTAYDLPKKGKDLFSEMEIRSAEKTGDE